MNTTEKKARQRMHHARGDVYVQGGWLPEQEAAEVQQRIDQHRKAVEEGKDE